MNGKTLEFNEKNQTAKLWYENAHGQEDYITFSKEDLMKLINFLLSEFDIGDR